MSGVYVQFLRNKTKSTVREAAKKFGISKSSEHTVRVT
ncbi:MAG: sporulation transcriptional regulator SpoIIID [Clostridia bacterium]|nr:sporulation transcriptional regulator SpoIIID [Clostridia bacterium]